VVERINRLLVSLLVVSFSLTVAAVAAHAEPLHPTTPRVTAPVQAKPPASVPVKDLKPLAVPPTIVEQVHSLQLEVDDIKLEVEDIKARVQSAEKGIATLQSGMSSLHNKLSEYLAKVTYTCKTPTVSRNGAGAEQDCSPYLCINFDGRCAPHKCESVLECAPGYACSRDYVCIKP